MKPVTESDHLRFYQFIIESLPVGIMTVDADLRITSFNPWAEDITGYSRSRVLGHYCGEILQGGMCKAQCPLRTVIARQDPLVRLETTILDKNGRTIPVRMNTAALMDDNGDLMGGVEAFQDISYLKGLERERESFVSMIAHDMKSSLTVIGGFVLRLLKKSVQLDGGKRDRYLEIIRSETQKLESMTNDFLEFSRLQTGKLKLDLAPTSLEKEISELLEAYELKAAQSEIRLELKIPEALPIIEADALRLRRVFTNLLDNALKFSKPGGTIFIIIQERDHTVNISVEDQGMGIDPDDLPHIFVPFHQGNVSDKATGFGLGLAAVKAIVEGHGGVVEVESELGKGSVFTVVLPKSGKGGKGVSPMDSL
jgi:two-component system phosphate regulon sensor histidine kinase PhoR